MISCAELNGLGNGNSVITPSVVMRPILARFLTVNQMLPSGPVTIWNGLPPEGIGYSLTLIAKAEMEADSAKRITTNDRITDREYIHHLRFNVLIRFMRNSRGYQRRGLNNLFNLALISFEGRSKHYAWII
jgi:hypothetical protein